MDPNDLSLRELRTQLKRIGLSPSGTKGDLQKRLKMAIDNKTPSNPSNLENINTTGNGNDPLSSDSSPVSSVLPGAESITNSLALGEEKENKRRKPSPQRIIIVKKNDWPSPIQSNEEQTEGPVAKKSMWEKNRSSWDKTI